MTLRILLADDDTKLRSALRALIESRPDWCVVAEAVNGRDAVDKAGQLKPDIITLDYSMPELDGISAITQIRRLSPETEIVLLTVHDARYTVHRAVEAGARGYVVKSEIMRDLMPAIEAASQRRAFLSFYAPEPGRTRDPET